MIIRKIQLILIFVLAFFGLSLILSQKANPDSTSVKNKKYDYVLPSASRYSTLAGEITDVVIANNLTDKINPLKNQFTNHIKVLQGIYEIYPKNINSVEYKYIEDDINYLKLLL